MPGLDDLLTGLMFANRRGQEDPDRMLGEALMRRRFLSNGINGQQPMRGDMRDAEAISDVFPNRAPDDATMPPSAALNQGGMFGGMRSWEPGERPTSFGPAPEQPPSSIMRYTDDTETRSDLPPVIVNPRGGGRGVRATPGQGGPMPGPGAAGAGGGFGPSGPAAAPAGGGLMESLGVTPDARRRIASALAAGFAGMKNSPFGGEAFSTGFGAAMGGVRKADAEQEALREKALDRGVRMRGQDLTHEYQMGNLDETAFNNRSNDAYRRRSGDIAQQNADSLEDYRRTQGANSADRNDIAREGLDDQRNANKSIGDYRKRVLDAQFERLGIQREGNDIKARAGDQAPAGRVPGGLPRPQARNGREAAQPQARHRPAARRPAGQGRRLEQAGPSGGARLRARRRCQGEAA